MKQNFLINLYDDKSQFKIITVLIALLIGGASVFYTNYVVSRLAEHERQEIELYARAMEFITSAQSDNDDGEATNFIVEQIIRKVVIPAILTDDKNQPLSSANISFSDNISAKRKTEILLDELEIMKTQHPPVEINVAGLKQRVYYRNSDVLYQLQYYPYVQLSIVAVFIILTFLAFSAARRAEQNRVWVGLAKETAHQLGTPISSLMAWIEYFRSDEHFSHRDAIPELEKDVQKLEMITARFSNIGSVPTLTEENLREVLENIIAYLQKRISTKVKMRLAEGAPDLAPARINRHLFEWVIENLCKNAVDAMGGGSGEVNITLRNQANKWVIDIADTGKGIAKGNLRKVFEPGFSTKKRGWGLGLTLAKRIIENYHQGKIFVRSSEPGKGTTFRIMLDGQPRETPPAPLAQRAVGQKMGFWMVFVLGWLSLQCAPKQESVGGAAAPGQPAKAKIVSPEKPKLPNFEMRGLDNKVVSAEQLAAGKPTVLVFFKPDCEHCQREAEQIGRLKASFAHTNLLMVSWDELPEIRKFAEKYGLQEPVRLYQINPNTLAQLFGTIQLPSAYVYDANQNLIQQFSGETRVEAILSYVPEK